MPVPLIAIPAIELAFQIIERAIADGQVTPEEATKRVNAVTKAVDASEKNLDDVINRAEAKNED